MRDVEVVFSEVVRGFLESSIQAAGGNEVFFLGRVSWSRPGSRPVAAVEEVDLLARGNPTSVPAVIHRAEGWHLAIHNHPSGRLEPSEADLHVAGELGARSIGFAIISNDARRQYVVIPPFENVGEAEKLQPIDPEEVRRVFMPGGPLSAELGGFEAREGQVEMALAVTRALNEDRVVALEAGTGIGKSLAYLVPSVLWAVLNRKKVVVSTGTINLQEQLTQKDLPLLTKVMPVKFQFALVKGRGNYACRRKLAEVEADLKQGSIVRDDSTRQLTSLVEWARTTRIGSRSELAWIPPPQVWEQVMSEADKSLKSKCPHHDECFFYEAKRRATMADVLVVNHHLLFADLAVRRETEEYDNNLVIPAYRRVVFDEAHHLEDVASEYFGLRFSQVGIRARIGRLLSTQSHAWGVIPALSKRVSSMGDPVAAARLEKAYSDTILEVRERLEDCFHDLEETVLQASPQSRRTAAAAEPALPLVEEAPPRSPDGQASGEAEASLAPQAGFQIRYRGDGESEDFWTSIRVKIAEAEKELVRLLAVNDQALGILERSKLTPDQVEAQSLELTSFGSRLASLIADMTRFCDFEEEGIVRWIGLRPGKWRREGHILEFATAPIRVAEGLKASLYDLMRSVVMTSATLSVAGKADFLADRLGLSLIRPGRFQFSEYPSPFDYKSQAITAVPTDFPLPDSIDFERSVPEAVLQILQATGGRAFVLFTSYSLLRKTHAATAQRLKALGLKPVAQGEAPRSELLSRFRSGVANVLFGTDSFWEGVDVQGRALECVILTRLPFRVPTEPVQEARMEDLEARGENPFTSFTIPQAVLKFKQGFGRLIRSQTDRGVVVVLDRRIITKPYGRIFLASLPETELLKAPLAEVTRRIKTFFGEPRTAVLDVPPAKPGADWSSPETRSSPEEPPW